MRLGRYRQDRRRPGRRAPSFHHDILAPQRQAYQSVDALQHERGLLLSAHCLDDQSVALGATSTESDTRLERVVTVRENRDWWASQERGQRTGTHKIDRDEGKGGVGETQGLPSSQ